MPFGLPTAGISPGYMQFSEKGAVPDYHSMLHVKIFPPRVKRHRRSPAMATKSCECPSALLPWVLPDYFDYLAYAYIHADCMRGCDTFISRLTARLGDFDRYAEVFTCNELIVPNLLYNTSSVSYS